MTDLYTTNVQAGEAALEQHGIRGMKWGIRRKDPSSPATPANIVDSSSVTVKSVPGKGVRGASGGRQVDAHPDAKNAAAVRQLAKASTLDSVSNAELKAAINRMQMEKQFRDLASSRPQSGVKAFIKKILHQKGKEDINSLLKGEEAKNIKFVRDGINKGRAKAAASSAAKAGAAAAAGAAAKGAYKHGFGKRGGAASRTAQAGLHAARAVVKGTVTGSRPGW